MIDSVRVTVQRVAGAEDLPLPEYATEQAAGMDLYAALASSVVLEPGKRAIVPTGICVALPSGTEAQVRPRSGRAWRDGLGMVNSPGTIDADYRGEIQVIVINWGEAPITIARGDRIAQLVVAPVLHVAWDEVAHLDATTRGEGGFGHTGRA